MSPSERRLAVQVEDHPVEYATFSGDIPEGEYGAGRSLIWDEGTFDVPKGEDASRGWEEGRLSFALKGKKLRGGFSLVRMKGRERNGKPQWLLIKKDDEYADEGWRLELEEDDPRFDAKPAAKKAPPAKKRKVVEQAPAEVVSQAAFLKRERLEGDAGLRLGKTTVPVTSLDKVYWPREGYTKGDLIRYYVRMGRHIMPHLKDRPAILKRYPNGVRDEGFFQHDVTSAPALLKTEVLASETGRKLNYAVYTDLASLVYLVNIGTIAQNPWHSRTDDLDKPDYVVFDLDPHGAPFGNVLEIALALRAVLEEVGMRGYAKTSGSSGIHVYVPVRRRYTFDQTAGFAEKVSGLVAERNPKIATVERRIAERKKNQVYVDWQQNARGKSAASVYSARAKAGATVSAPVTWEEIERGFKLSDFTIVTMPDRIDEVGDLWKDYLKDRQALADI
jgi:bifunctional non-homologous end joining protein LigD